MRKHLFIECDSKSGGRLKVGKYTQFSWYIFVYNWSPFLNTNHIYMIKLVFLLSDDRVQGTLPEQADKMFLIFFSQGRNILSNHWLWNHSITQSSWSYHSMSLCKATEVEENPSTKANNRQRSKYTFPFFSVHHRSCSI